ncbi:MAG: hypothetical protein OES26_19295 [Gammaproteobacteria bacterium]|nr:hypothetical protein [Gammaproteobacteria bacterium]
MFANRRLQRMTLVHFVIEREFPGVKHQERQRRRDGSECQPNKTVTE